MSCLATSNDVGIFLTRFRVRPAPFLVANSDFLRRSKVYHALNGAKFHSTCSRLRGNTGIVCKAVETQPPPDENSDQVKISNEDEESPVDAQINEAQVNSDSDVSLQDVGNTSTDVASQGAADVDVTSGSPLPGVKPQMIKEAIRIPKETVDILKDQVFGFDTFFVTNQEPYEGGVLFKGNLRGEAAKSYEKIARRLQNKFGDQYKLFLLVNPEDDKPVAVVVPRKTLQPEKTAVPEWLAAASFGLVSIFTLILHNVPSLQFNLLSTFDNPELLRDGVSGAIVTAAVLGVHEFGHRLAAKSRGITLGVPFFVPSWQIGSFGAITRITNIVPRRDDLLAVASAGPIAGFSLAFLLFLLGFLLPPADGAGLVIDASAFHESFLVGGIAKLLLGDALKEGGRLSVNPLVIWAWTGLLINAINSIPAGELDGGRISFAVWGRKASSRLTALSIGLLGLSSLFNDVAFYWVILVAFLQRGPIAPLSDEVTVPQQKSVYLGVVVLLVGLLVCLPYPFPFTQETLTNF